MQTKNYHLSYEFMIVGHPLLSFRVLSLAFVQKITLMKTRFSLDKGLKKMADKSTKLTLLPVARIRTIMKSSPDITVIGQESLFLITKATELFVQHIAQESYNRSQNKTSLAYGNLAQVVDEDIAFQFLADVLPKKVLARDYLQSLENSS